MTGQARFHEKLHEGVKDSAERRFMNPEDREGSVGMDSMIGAPQISEHITYGEDQGGLRDWFRGIRGKKKRPDEAPVTFDGKTEDQLLISEPVLQSAVKHKLSPDGAGLKVDATADYSQIADPDQRASEMKYNEFLYSDAAPFELAKDPAIQERVLSEFTQDVRDSLAGSLSKGITLSGPDADDPEAYDRARSDQEKGALLAAMRLNQKGVKGMGQLLRGSMPEHFYDAIMDYGSLGMKDIDQEHLAEVFRDIKGEAHSVEDYLTGSNGAQEDEEVKKMVRLRNGVYGYVQGQIDREGSPIADYLSHANDALTYGGEAVGSDDTRSAILINFLMNRTVTPHIDNTIAPERIRIQKETADAQRDLDEASGPLGKKRAQSRLDQVHEEATSSQKMFEFNRWLQMGTKFDAKGASLEGRSSAGFLSSLKKHFGKKR